MSLPKAAFLDTSVFAGQQYNYSSTAITSFVPVANKSNLKILLPDPTSREIDRQIQERSTEALKALEDARRKAPFLSKWKQFPSKLTSWEEWEVGRVAEKEWLEFLKQFQVEQLGYEGVSISKIMSWYDSIRAPFGEGKKRKEFPDAFAIEIVALYAEKNNVCVAVVSEDQDIKKACEHYPSLLYFPSLPRLTELLLVGEQELDELRKVLEGDIELLVDAIYQEATSLDTYIFDDRFEVIDDSIHSPQIIDIRIVGIGHNECTVVFSATFESEHKVKWDEAGDPADGYTDTCSEWINQTNSIDGTAKLAIDLKNKKITAVSMIELDATEIEIQKLPRRY